MQCCGYFKVFYLAMVDYSRLSPRSGDFSQCVRNDAILPGVKTGKICACFDVNISLSCSSMCFCSLRTDLGIEDMT